MAEPDGSALDDLMNDFPDRTVLSYARAEGDKVDEDSGAALPDKVTVVLSFSEKGLGFGEIALVEDLVEGRMFVDTEHMRKETVQRILLRLLDNAIFDTDDDPVKHKLYNEKMKRQCGAGCKVCYGDK
jgi:hypothetical protein